MRPKPSEPRDAPRALGGVDLSARLERWAADARVDEAARRRSRERWLRQQAEEAATLEGLLADLAERAAPVAVQTAAGHRHRGAVRSVGADFVALEGARSAVLVASAAIVSVRTQPGVRPALGDRPAIGRNLLSEVLTGMAAEREPAVIVPRHGGDPVVGALMSVGRDVVAVRASGERPATVYVRLAAIGEVVLGS
jgi:hypothetical protein